MPLKSYQMCASHSSFYAGVSATEMPSECVSSSSHQLDWTDSLPFLHQEISQMFSYRNSWTHRGGLNTALFRYSREWLEEATFKRKYNLTSVENVNSTSRKETSWISFHSFSPLQRPPLWAKSHVLNFFQEKFSSSTICKSNKAQCQLQMPFTWNMCCSVLRSW